MHLVKVYLTTFLILISHFSFAQTCQELDGAYVYSQESAPTYLGFFGSRFASESIMNEFGSYGSSFSSTSVRNEFGAYGSQFRSYSANNEFASFPPIIYKNGIALYFLTTNNFKSPGVSLAAIDSSCTFFSSSPDFPVGLVTPSSPLIVVADDGQSTSELAVVWSPVNGATIYNVYISETLGNFLYIGSTQFTFTSIKSLQQGVLYYVAVTAANSVGESNYTIDTGFLATSLVRFTVTPSAAANGSITPSTPQEIEQGRTVQFQVNPDSGYDVASVGGTCGGLLQGNTFTTSAVNANCTVSATFEPSPTAFYTVTPSAAANGSITPSTPQEIEQGRTVQFQVNPDSGYDVASVGGTCGGLLQGNTFTTSAVNANCTVSATFEPSPTAFYTVTPSAAANGSITPSTPQSVADNSNAQFTITPTSGFQISAVGGTCGGTLTGKAYTTSTITQNCTVSAEFELSLAVPSRPVITQSDVGDAEIYLRALSESPGTPITSYEFTCTNGVNETTRSSLTGYIVVAGLINGVSYTCSATATNLMGISTASAESTPLTPEEMVASGLPMWLLYEATKPTRPSP